MSDRSDDGEAASRVAVIGMAGRFPGAPDVATFWKNVRGGVESVKFFTDEELLAAGEDPAVLHDPAYVKAWPVLEDIELFDAGFFGMSPRDAAVMDPQHRFFLEVAWSAMEDAGYARDPHERSVGVFAACGMNTYMMYHLVTNAEIMRTVGEWLVRHNGNDMNFLATRVSYQMNLTGPSLNVQTACSSSLVALHLACQSLLNGECDMALAGASAFSLPQNKGYLFKEGEILSPDGHCRPFDAASAGTLFGSGTGCLVLKRLDDAIADGDNVLAVVRGSAINNDGSQKVGYLAPSVDGQARAIAEALAMADVDPATVSYIETHGTGTAVGDPIEIAALTEAYGGRMDRHGTCAIGSVKGNIGHIGEAAGMASLIKVILGLQHRQLPPSINFERPNPQIDFAKTPFFVNDKLREWSAPAGAPRRAGVTSLGAGGTNAHAIIEEAPPPAPRTKARVQQLLVLSAKSAASLDRAATALASHLEAHPDSDLADVAYALQMGRKPFNRRRIVVCRDVATAVAGLREPASPTNTHQLARAGEPSIVFMFPGGGAQYAGMGRDLFLNEPAYAQALEACLGTLEGATARELRALMLPEKREQAAASATLERPSLALPALFATEYATAMLLRSWGVEPAAFIGHSMGEYVAACLAGVFSVRDGMAVVRERGRLFERLPPGGMLAVALSEAELEALLDPSLSIAAINAPGLCVASGPVEALDALERTLAERQLDTTRIHISVAAHSKMLEPILAEFEAFCRTIRLNTPQMPFVSNVTGAWITPALATDPAYWARHLRSTVRFAEGLGTLVAGGERVLIEVGPGRTLSSLVRQHGAMTTAVPSMRHPREEADDVSFLLQSVGRLWMAGADIQFERLQDAGRRRVSLPTYAFDRSRYWVEAGKPTAAEAKPLGALAKKTDIASWFYVPIWKPGPPAARQGDGRPWLMFCDEAGLADKLAARLPDQAFIRVVAGAAYQKRDDRDYVVRPEAREDYEALFDDLAQGEAFPEQIVYLWPTDGPELAWPRAVLSRLRRPRPVDGFAESERVCFTALLSLAQALGPLERPVTLSVVSTGLHGLGAGDATDPAKALLLGPVKVIPREFPHLEARSIDVGGWDGHTEAVIERLADELSAPARENVVALRGLQRWTQSFEPLSLDAAAGARGTVRAGGVYLITGGLGGLGLTLAAHLATTARAKLVLVGRTPLPQRSQWTETIAAGSALSRRLETVLAIEAAGGEVLLATADVTSRADMERVRARAQARFGAVNGIIHTAGLLDDDLISLKTGEAARRVIAVKAQGALVLDEVFGRDALELFVVFSSVSSVLGLEGQIDYTAANAFLDAFAARKAAEGRTHTIAIGWNAWQEVGMAAAIVDRDRQPGAPVAGPWLERLASEAADETLFATGFARGKQWLVSEHVVRGGEALIPGTGYLELARAAFCRDGVRPVEIRDVTFLAPFTVLAGQTRELKLRLSRAPQGGSEVTFFSESVEEPHVTARIGEVTRPAPPPADTAALLARCTSGLRAYGGFMDQGFMDFGPRWANVDRVHFGVDEAVIVLSLPDAFVDDLANFPLHPALLDMATGAAQQLIDGFDADKDFYVPFAYARLTVHRPLTARLYSHVRFDRGGGGREVAVFDVTIYDGDGQALVDISGFTMKRASRAFSTAAAPPPVAAPAPARHDFGTSKLGSAVKLGILPPEGMEAFDRIISSRVGGQIIASSVDLRDWMAEVDRQARPVAVEESGADTGFARPSLGAAFTAPRNEVERTLAGMWREVLGLKEVGVHDDFFELGGQSLMAVRLFNKIRKHYGIDLPLSTLFAAPTIESCTRVVAAEAGISLVDDQSSAAPVDLAVAPADTAGATRSLYRHAWRHRTRERGDERQRHTWLAFLDDTGLVEALCRRLRAEGHTVVSVLAGDTFDRVSDDEYVILAEPIPEGYTNLLRDLDASGRTPDRILHAWLVTDEETFRPGSSFLHSNLERGFFSLRCLQQALSARPAPGPLHLTMLATGMQRIGDEPLPYPEKAAALGPLIALPGELPGFTWSAVDVMLPSRPKGLLSGISPSPRSLLHALAARAREGDDDDIVDVALVDSLRAEVLAPARDQLVALRGGARWVRGVEPVNLEGRPALTGFKERGVYLLTGGLEGAGATLTQALARRHRARLVLIDPAPQPDGADAEAWMARHPHDRTAARVRRALELEALGAEVMTAAAEVTDVDRLRDVVLAAEARFGRIDGVIHAEGASSADPVTSGSLAEAAGVFAPRIHGTLALSDVFRDRPLDFFVAWSPVGAADGAGGQASEAGAAAFLDAFAEVNHDRRVVALAWDAGVGSTPGADPDDEFDTLEKAVRSCNRGSVLASSVDPRRRQAPAQPVVAVAAETPEASSRRLAHPEPVRAPRRLDIKREPPRHMYLVRMHPGSQLAKPPLFLVAGLFGNVLNLRYLAQILGAERPVYGLQARGLFGGHEPHETFEEMARDYLVELRTVQPHGPYLLGGFSGGGITAYEMARQLMSAGEAVQLVVLLDTPVPRREQLSPADRASIHFQNLQRQGPGYVRRWLEHKIEHRLRLQRRAERLRAQRGGESRDFRSQIIEAAFYRALGRYQMPSLPISVALFRPKIDPTYRLSRGRMLSKDRSALYPDNGWTPYVENLDIQEVPGNHDGMVLEPHVRVLAARIEVAMARASGSAVTLARVAGDTG